MLNPVKYFGLEEAEQWWIAAKTSNPKVCEQMTQPEILAGMYALLRQLIEERVPIKDVRTILHTLANIKAAAVKGLNPTLRISARASRRVFPSFTDQHFWTATGSKFYEADSRSELHTILDGGAPGWEGEVKSRVGSCMTGTGVSFVVVSNYRRALWERTEELFVTGEIRRPVIVLSAVEVGEVLKDLAKSPFPRLK